MSTFWIILACINVVFLIAFMGGRNAVWGGLTMGAFIGLLVAVGFGLFGDSGFHWQTIVKWAVSLSLYGAFTEVGARLKRRQKGH